VVNCFCCHPLVVLAKASSQNCFPASGDMFSCDHLGLSAR